MAEKLRQTDIKRMLANVMNVGEKEFTSRIGASLRKKYDIRRADIESILSQAIAAGHLVETKRVGAAPGIPLYSIRPADR